MHVGFQFESFVYKTKRRYQDRSVKAERAECNSAPVSVKMRASFGCM